MSSRCRSWALALLAAAAAAACTDGRAAAVAPPPLRACADPNNLPFTNRAGEGLENRLAELIADELGTTVEYTWWPQRRGFVRHTLNAGECDLLLGVPAGFELAWTTRPYYRSSYVFVTRADGPQIASLDDPVLRTLRIGVPMVGDDYSNTPPADALTERGLEAQIVGYTVYGNYAEPNPPARLIDAVAGGDVDVAIAWGPLAGYFAQRADPPLRVTPVRPAPDTGAAPLVFDIALAVRRGDSALHDSVEAVLQRRRADVAQLLADYGVPIAEGGP